MAIEQTLIDCHVHLAVMPDDDNGCYISPKMLRSPLFRFLLWKHPLHPDKPEEANQKSLCDLLTELRTSRQIQQAVLLGMDGVYDQNGRLNQAHTDFLSATIMCSRARKPIPENSWPAAQSIAAGRG